MDVDARAAPAALGEGASQDLGADPAGISEGALDDGTAHLGGLVPRGTLSSGIGQVARTSS